MNHIIIIYVFYPLFYGFLLSLFIFILIYLGRTIYLEFQKSRILTLCYQRSTSGLTRGISESGMIYLSHNLRFEEQINYLYSRGYQTISLDDFLDMLHRKAKLPAKPLLLMLDQGYRSNYLYTLPILKKYGFSATLFLSPDPQSEAYTQLKGIDLPLSDRQIQEMSQQGIAFGSYGLTNQPFSNLTEEGLSWELTESKNRLKQLMRKEIEYLAIPARTISDKKITFLCQKAGYKIIFGNRVGTNNKQTNPLHLRRIIIHRDMNISEFKKFLSRSRICRARIFDDLKYLLTIIVRFLPFSLHK